MAEMCRKLETEEEKVLPFFSPSLTVEEVEQVAHIEGEQPFEELSKVIIHIHMLNLKGTHNYVQ